jgi:hypothetical protein
MVSGKVEITPHPVRGAVQLRPVVARAFSAAVAKQEIVRVVIDAPPKRTPSGKSKCAKQARPIYLLLNAGGEADPNDPLVRVVLTAMAAARKHGAGWVLGRLAEVDGAVQQDSKRGPIEPGEDWRAREAENWKRLQAEFFQRYRSVSAPELADLTNSQATNRWARAHDWAKAGKIFSVNDGTNERFPVFQLHDGAPNPVIGRVLGVLRGHLTPWQIAMWLTTPNPEFEGWRTPLDLLDAKPDAVVAAAQREVEDTVF